MNLIELIVSFEINEIHAPFEQIANHKLAEFENGEFLVSQGTPLRLHP